MSKPSIWAKSLLNGGKSNPRPFDIKLESCDLSVLTDKTVTITGPESRAIVGSSARGADTGITTDEDTNVPLGTASSATKTQQGDNTLMNKTVPAFQLAGGTNDLVLYGYVIGEPYPLAAHTLRRGAFEVLATFDLNYP